MNDKKPVENKVVEALIEKGWHISFAESCTGGLAAGRLVNVPDASRVFDLGFVTYSNEMKTEFLGVEETLIDEYGVVSEPAALAMARGCAQKAGAQIGVGISGIAGPSGAVPGKPVGTVCFGFKTEDKEVSYTRYFGDIGRNTVREKSVEFVFETLVKILEQ